jgi:uncharacterized protein involved in outer membrane biogenesis
MASLRVSARAALTATGVLIGLAVVLLAAATWLVPVVLTRAAADWVETHHHHYRPGIIRFNPLTLTLRATDVGVVDLHDSQVLGFATLEARLAARSLWDGQLELESIRVDGLVLDAKRDLNGHLNLNDLLPTPDPRTPYPKVRIGGLTVRARALTWSDASLSPATASIRLTEASLELRDFDTRSAANAYHLRIRSERDEHLELDGTLALTPLATQARVTVQGFDLARFGRAGAGVLPVQSGWIDATGRIDLTDADDGVRARIDLPSIDGHRLDAGPDARLAEFHARGVTIDTTARRLTVTGVDLEAPAVAVRRSHDGAITLAGVGAADTPDASPPPWTLSIAHVGVRGASLALEDAKPEGGVRLELTHVSLGIDGWTNDGQSPLRVTAEGAVADDGRFRLAGSIDPADRATSISLHAQRLPLTVLQPYLTPLLPVEIRAGRAGGDLDLTHAHGEWQARGRATVDDLSTTTRAGDLFAVRHLGLEGVEAGSEPAHVSIRTVLAEAPSAHIDVAPDGRPNYEDLLDAASRASTPTPGTPVTIAVVQIHDGTMDFRDRSLKPIFDARVGALQGEIDDLSSDPSTRAHLSIDGRVDRYAPVSIKGDINLLASPIAADLAINFDNVELTGFTPYAGRFAGYRIDKGKASARFEYHVAHRTIMAKHHVRLKQLELGARVESPDAPEWPLRFAVALLKDRDGNIDVDVPLTGSFDDPNFEFGPVVREVLWNLVGKIVTSPFRWLGGLFGHAEETAALEFAPGSAQLNDADRDRLAGIGKALGTRPGLSVEVPVAVLPALDTPIVGSEGLDALGDARAAAVQGALLDGTELDPGRVFIVRDRAPVASQDGSAVRVELGLR